MIDFGFYRSASVGLDLTQPLVGEVQLGRRGAHDLADLDHAIVAAYVDGLRAEGCTVPAEHVRRRCTVPAEHVRQEHALCLLLMTGLSKVPFDVFKVSITAAITEPPPSGRLSPATPST